MVPDLVGMEVDSPPLGCSISPEFQSWSPFAAMSLSPQIPNHAGTEAGCLSYQLMPLDLQNQQQVPLQAASPPALDVAPYQINPIQMRLSCLSKTWNHPALHAIE